MAIGSRSGPSSDFVTGAAAQPPNTAAHHNHRALFMALRCDGEATSASPLWVDQAGRLWKLLVMTVASVLARAQTVVAQGNRPPVAVFDLDGTLFDNGPRTCAILADGADQQGLVSVAARLRALPGTRLPYQLKDILALVDVTDDSTVATLAAHWQQHFFTDEQQRHDEPLAGALSFVDRLWQMGTTIVYLSGRDVPNMLVGVTESLRRHRFPVGLVRTTIILKPDFHQEDLAFKRSTLPYVDTLGTVIASFDNEPANCNLFAAQWPTAATYWLRTSNTPHAPPLSPNIHAVDDFVD
jgi:hypothetical protein